MYALSLYPYLRSLDPTLLISLSALKNLRHKSIKNYLIPEGMTPEQGSRGHFKRLLWTQFELAPIYRNLNSHLLFSPLTEAPVFNKCRYIVTIHDVIPLRFPRISSPLTHYFRHWVPQVLNQAQHVFCNSEATAKDISKFFNIPAQKLTAILLAHDGNHFRCLDMTQDRFNAQPYFLYVGRHDPHKNLQRLISAFAQVGKDYQLLLAGQSDRRYTPALKLQVKELGLNNQIKFLEYVSYQDLPILMNGAIALVFPSLWEGFGLPVLEAMACGTPVITSNLSSLPEVTGSGAILIDPYSVLEITDAMQLLAGSATERSRLKEEGLARAKQFSWEQTGKATVEVLARFT